MLVAYESTNQRKAQILASIKQDRAIISSFTAHNIDKVYDESIQILRNEIKQSFLDLVELERWRLKEKLDKDSPFKPPSLVAYESSLDAEDLEAYMEFNQTLVEEIIRLELEYKYGIGI